MVRTLFLASVGVGLVWAASFLGAQTRVELIVVSNLDLGYINTNTIVSWAASHVSRLDPDSRLSARYLSMHNIPPKDRLNYYKVVSLALNKISGFDQAVIPQIVPGTCNALLYFDIRSLQEDFRDGRKKLNPKFAQVFDRLGELGSGPAPFPEPFFHLVRDYFSEVPEVKESYQEPVYERVLDGPHKGKRYIYTDPYTGESSPKVIGYETKYKVTKTRREKHRTIAFGPGVDEAVAIGLVKLTGTNFPIFTAKWFIINVLVEPRYHEFLLLDDTLKSVEKLSLVDLRTSDDKGNTTRGAVLFSEVANRNRALERSPTQRQHGDGSFHISFDFKTSINAQNVIDDLLVNNSDAHEVIFTLANGLNGYFVSDGNGKRLDVAVADVAQARRFSDLGVTTPRKFSDIQVRTGYWCMFCHLSEKGYIEVADEYTEFAKNKITLYVARTFKDEFDRGRRVRQRYTVVSFNNLLHKDQQNLEAAIKTVTLGCTSSEINRLLQDTVWSYLEQPVSLEVLAWDVGYTPARVLQVIERNPGLSNVFTGGRIFRKQRRDQVEPVLGLLIEALYSR